MKKVRWLAVLVAALYAAYCLVFHIVVAVSRIPSVPDSVFAIGFVLLITLALAVLNFTRPAGPDTNAPAPRWFVPALVILALICGVWPTAVGSGVPNDPWSLLALFEDTGVPGGPPGDRSLNSHGRRVRAISEEEFLKLQRWSAVVRSGLLACFAGMTLAAALYFLQVRRSTYLPLQQNPATGSCSAPPELPGAASPAERRRSAAEA